MTSKITLYLDESIIEEIRYYTQEKNSSVLKISNEFFKDLFEFQKSNREKSSITNSLLGSLKIETFQEEYKTYLEAKYL